jgi:cAMP-dependent protein kinase regulator
MGKNMDPRKLKDEASEAVAKGKHKKALEAYEQLELLEPAAGSWSRRAGEMLRHLGKKDAAVAKLVKSADKYAEVGFIVKAVAMCKLILRIDPSHTATQQRLASYNDERGMRVKSRPRVVPPPAAIPVAPPPPAIEQAPEPIVASSIEEAIASATLTVPTLAPGAPLEAISLRASVPGAVVQLDEDGNDSGVIDIPIELDELIVDDDSGIEESRAETREALEDTPLFTALPVQALESLINKVQLVELEAGQVLFKQGDAGDTLYVISDGSVSVISEGPPRVTLSKLEENAFFGEVALVTEQPRTATIEAAEETQLLAIDRTVVSELMAEMPGVLPILLRFLRDRLINTLVTTSALFEPFGGDERKALASKFRFLEVDPGARLVAQGARSEGLYVILSGSAEVVRDEADAPKRLATLGPGDLFGEMSLLTGQGAVATVRGTAKSFVLMLPSSTFREVIMTHPQVLMFIGDLADERRRKLEAIVAGEQDYAEGHLDLL